MTETLGIALILLGCPVILGGLLVVLSAVEDSLSRSASPAVRDSIAEPRGTGSAPSSTTGARPVDAARVAEGAHL